MERFREPRFELFSEDEWQALADRLDLPDQLFRTIRLMLSGLSTDEIAETMELSVSTVRMHFRRLFRRWNARDRVGLAVIVFVEYNRLIKD